MKFLRKQFMLYCLAIPSISAPPSISVSTFLGGRINLGLKVLWLDWCPCHYTGVHAWLEASSGSISPLPWVSAKVTSTDSWEPPYPRSLARPWDVPTQQLQIAIYFSSYLTILRVSPHTWSWKYPLSFLILLSYPVSSLHLPPTTISFPLLSKIQVSSLGPSCWFSFFGSVEFSTSILNFIANIYLSVSM